ncbi:cytochrome P450 [Mucidula mucida]|nr:cytochrome P450 [Mucidula mucida]
MHVSLLLAFSIAYCAIVVIYRLYFHPLRAVPGPRLGAVSGWYQAYHDIWKDGYFTTHLKDLHNIYGPVVRTRPNELHFCSPEAYFAIYTARSGFTKDPQFYRSFGEDESSFGLVDVQKHKQRRNIMSPLFSRRAIVQLEHVIQEKIELFMESLRESSKVNAPVNLHRGFRALTMDTITAYCYGNSFGALSTPDFKHPILISLGPATPIATASRHFPILHLFKRLPYWFAQAINRDMIGVVQLHRFVLAQIDGILHNPDSLRSAEHETIYHHLLPETPKRTDWPSRKSLHEEALNLLFAGTDTTANAIETGVLHIFSDERVKKKLLEELIDAYPEKETPVAFEVVEKLPYLTSVIKESLRLSSGVPVALPRIAQADTVIDGVAVPAGAIVGTSAKFLLRNPAVFSIPDKFIPERWMQSDAQQLEKYLVVFSRGPRSCLGQNLAWCELYLIFSHLVRKFHVQLYDTSVDDVGYRDHMLPVWRGKQLQALVREQAC